MEDAEREDDMVDLILETAMTEIAYPDARQVLALAMGTFLVRYKEPCRTSILSGEMWVHEVLNGHWKRSVENFRMKTHVFRNLCELLQTRYGFRPTRGVSAEEALALLLYNLGHQVSNRLLQERFQRSGETITRQFQSILAAAARMVAPMTQSNIPETTHPHIRNSRMYWPAFKDCVGAMDGTHVQVKIAEDENVNYVGRKGFATQNVLAICDFDMCFTYISAGWEGCTHDTRILYNVMRDPRMRFPRPPPGKYYLVDAGYPNMQGFLAPYSGDARMHLGQFRRGDAPRNAKEKFNRRHASLRSVIERAFGVLKGRWKILEAMPPYRDIDDQVTITGVTMALHNYVRRSDREDAWFNFAERYGNRHRDQEGSTSGRNVPSSSNPDIVSANMMVDDTTMQQVRDEITSIIISEE